MIGSLTRKKEKVDNNFSKEDIAAIYKIPTEEIPTEEIKTAYMEFAIKEESKRIVQVFKMKNKLLLKQRQLQAIANRTKKARIRDKNIKRLVSLIEKGKI